MDNQEFWEKFDDYVEGNDDLFDSTTSNMVRNITGEENPMFAQINRVMSNRVINDSRTLTLALSALETYLNKSSFDNLLKEQIISHISTIEEHCESQDFRRRLSPFMLNLIYQTVCAYGTRLAEFDVDQQRRIINVIDSLHNYVTQ